MLAVCTPASRSSADDGAASSVDSISVSVADVDPTPVIAAICATRLEGTPITVTDSADASDTLTYSNQVFKDRAPFDSGGGVNQTSFSFTPADNSSYGIVLIERCQSVAGRCYVDPRSSGRHDCRASN